MRANKQNLLAENFFIALLFSLAFVTLFTACGKTEKTGADSPDLLTSKPWILVKIEYRYAENGSWQEAIIPDCQKDDTRLFKEDNTLEYNGGVVKCDPNEKQANIVANWKWNDAKTAFIITDIATNVTTINKVIEVKETKQIVTFSVDPGNGGAITYYKTTLIH
jgi:hypothetical protein